MALKKYKDPLDQPKGYGMTGSTPKDYLQTPAGWKPPSPKAGGSPFYSNSGMGTLDSGAEASLASRSIEREKREVEEQRKKNEGIAKSMLASNPFYGSQPTSTPTAGAAKPPAWQAASVAAANKFAADTKFAEGQKLDSRGFSQNFLQYLQAGREAKLRQAEADIAKTGAETGRLSNEAALALAQAGLATAQTGRTTYLTPYEIGRMQAEIDEAYGRTEPSRAQIYATRTGADASMMGAQGSLEKARAEAEATRTATEKAKLLTPYEVEQMKAQTSLLGSQSERTIAEKEGLYGRTAPTQAEIDRIEAEIDAERENLRMSQMLMTSQAVRNLDGTPLQTDFTRALQKSGLFGSKNVTPYTLANDLQKSGIFKSKNGTPLELGAIFTPDGRYRSDYINSKTTPVRPL